MDEPKVKIDNDIIMRLGSLQDPIRNALADARFELIMNRKEIERLRALITEWADAVDVWHEMAGKGGDEWDNTQAEKIRNAQRGLRKAVGR